MGQIKPGDIVPHSLWLSTSDDLLLAQPGCKLKFEMNESRYDAAYNWALALFGQDLHLAMWECPENISTFILATTDQALLFKLTWGGV